MTVRRSFWFVCMEIILKKKLSDKHDPTIINNYFSFRARISATYVSHSTHIRIR